VDWAHFGGNIPFVIGLSAVIIIRAKRDYFIVWAVSQFVGGFIEWIIGPTNVSAVGASGVVLGFFGFLLGRFLFERTYANFIIGFAFALLYGGTVLISFLPGRETSNGQTISWTSHLSGFIAGVLAAFLITFLYRRFWSKAMYVNNLEGTVVVRGEQQELEEMFESSEVATLDSSADY